MSYAWEQFHMALRTLAGIGTVQERLASAFNLHLLHIDPAELPEEIRVLFARVRQEIAPAGTADEGAAALSDDEALDKVDAIITMLDALARAEHAFE
jgi:hypothetical protein